MADEWNEMKNKVGGSVEILEFETTDNEKELKDFQNKHKKLEYSGVPTIFKINGGKIEYYSGERTADKMADWALGNKSKSEKILGGKKTKKGKKGKKIKRSSKRKTKKTCCWLW